MSIVPTSRFPAPAPAFCIALALIAPVLPAIGAQDQRQRYDLQAQPLAAALREVSARSGRSITAPAGLLREKVAPALAGDFTPEEIVSALLANSGLVARPVAGGFVIEAAPSSDERTSDKEQVSSEVVVTGSRIRGTAVASPVITIDETDIRNAGQATLGEVVRNIPQSFGGGQNPGVGLNVPTLNGANSGGGSSINLRGLGSDATLTLLNGKRLAYSGTRQSVDVSTIPIGALDRIEIVADGASALYGSDAVGGVANILLKRDFEGLETRARLGFSTDGGNEQQQYAATGGATWQGGGFIVAYEFNRNSAVEAAERDYAATRSPGLTLYPWANNHNGLISAHHQIGPIRLRVDGLFNRRRHGFAYANNPAGDLTLGRMSQRTDSRAFALLPALEWEVGVNWRAVLTGSLASERLDYRVDNLVGQTRSVLVAGCYCNSAQWVELAGDGPLLDLPAGAAKLAIGTGFRRIKLDHDRGQFDPLGFTRTQSNRYGYAELSLPLVAPGQAATAIHRLSLSAAARYEHYDSSGSVTTPKLGLIYAPFAGLELKASWGRSFRAPTLLQRYQPPSLVLRGAGTFGMVGAPPGATALLVQGGRTDLAPERATSWSVTAGIQPQQLPGFTAELSYFNTRYIDRIVTPIGFISQALRDPAYAAFVTAAPSVEQVNAVLAGGDYFVNATGVPFDPTRVVAIIDNSSVNAGRQHAHGVDLLASYRSKLASGNDSIAVSANVSYLASRRQISPAQPELQLAGILFNPPQWRGRMSASWTHGPLTVTGALNYTGELRDTRRMPERVLDDQARLDFALRYRADRAGPAWLRGLGVTLAVENLFNTPPPPIFVSAATDTPYDSTNYGPLGRVVSISIAKAW
ncbi:TonB-dependent receptor [Sphingomonas sp.]|uniref:TonB-dependent receptor n=1 Tax=Sphingomonas sp. TaxID=28214 RepID=UPI0031E3ED23